MKRSILTAVILAMLLSGCTHSGITLTAEEGNIPDCPSGSDPIPVADLNTNKNVSCKLADVDLLFPDGTLLNVDSGAASGSTTSTGAPNSGKIYSFYSVGIYGFAVGLGSSDCRRSQSWGSSKARKKVRDAFGPDWACQK